MKFVDTHCHLYHDFGSKTPEDLVREAKLAGVEKLVTIGVDRETIAVCREQAHRHPDVYFTAGVHPHEGSKVELGDLEAVETALNDPKCVAVGEIGLDYHYDFSPRQVQRDLLAAQLELAARLRKPAVIHCREAEADMLEALRLYVPKVTAGVVPGILHCFTGTREFGEACLSLGFYVSFSGVLTFKNSEALRDAARAFPLERLLVETDSPYLAPIPHRGKRCEPSMVVLTAEKLAEVKGLALSEIAARTTENAGRVFGWVQ